MNTRMDAPMNTQTNKTDDLSEAFHFPQGLAGFRDALYFAFVYEGKGDIVCLQSIDQPEAALLLTQWDTSRLGRPPQLTPDQEQCLKLAHGSEPMWMLVLNPFADKEWVTANLMAPVALNIEARLGLQNILPDPKLPLRYHWMPQPK